MKKWENPYSRFRYENDGSMKFRVDPLNSGVTVFGADQRAFRDNMKKQLDDINPCLNIGNTWVTNNVFTSTQINNVDQPVVNDKAAPRLTFFRLFKL